MTAPSSMIMRARVIADDQRPIRGVPLFALVTAEARLLRDTQAFAALFRRQLDDPLELGCGDVVTLTQTARAKRERTRGAKADRA